MALLRGLKVDRPSLAGEAFQIVVNETVTIADYYVYEHGTAAAQAAKRRHNGTI